MKYIISIITGLILAVSSAHAQSIDITPTSVNIGATTSTTAGALFQQSGQNTSFFTQDGINAPSLRLTIQPNGNVGVGTATPSEKLEVNGNLKVNSAVLAPTGTAPIYGCRAWVNFDGTRNAAGVVDSSNTARFIRGSGNVSSVVKNGTGSYTINFIIPMPDTNYAFTISSNIYGIYNSSYQSIVAFDSKTASSIKLNSTGDYPKGGVNDKEEICVTIIR